MNREIKQLSIELYLLKLKRILKDDVAVYERIKRNLAST